MIIGPPPKFHETRDILVDDDLIALLGVHPASCGSTPTGSSAARKTPGPIGYARPFRATCPGTARPRVPGEPHPAPPRPAAPGRDQSARPRSSTLARVDVRTAAISPVAEEAAADGLSVTERPHPTGSARG